MMPLLKMDLLQASKVSQGAPAKVATTVLPC